MDKLTQFRLRYKSQIFYSLIVMMCILGAYFASLIEEKYEVVVNGLLSSTLLYLIYLVFLSPKRIIRERVNENIEYPKDIKYLAIGFLVTMIMFWAAGHVINLVWYLFSIIVGN